MSLWWLSNVHRFSKKRWRGTRWTKQWPKWRSSNALLHVEEAQCMWFTRREDDNAWRCMRRLSGGPDLVVVGWSRGVNTMVGLFGWKKWWSQEKETQQWNEPKTFDEPRLLDKMQQKDSGSTRKARLYSTTPTHRARNWIYRSCAKDQTGWF